MTIEFFNKRMLFEPKLIAIEWPCRDLVFITTCRKDGTFIVIKSFTRRNFNEYLPNEILDVLTEYSHFMGLRYYEPKQYLLKQLDKIMNEGKTKCEVKLGKKQAEVKATTKGKL